MDLLDRLLDHDRWTTSEVLAIASRLVDAQLDQEFDVGHRTLRATFAHMIGNVEIWTGLMNASLERSHVSDDSMTGLARRHEQSYDAFAELARRVRDEERMNDTYLDTLDDPPVRKTFAGTIAHVITHDILHRSEALHILARLGVDNLPEGDVLGWESRVGGEPSDG